MGNNLKTIHIVPSYCSVPHANPIPKILICLHLVDGKTFQTFASLDTGTALTSISSSILNCNWEFQKNPIIKAEKDSLRYFLKLFLFISPKKIIKKKQRDFTWNFPKLPVLLLNFPLNISSGLLKMFRFTVFKLLANAFASHKNWNLTFSHALR